MNPGLNPRAEWRKHLKRFRLWVATGYITKDLSGALCCIRRSAAERRARGYQSARRDIDVERAANAKATAVEDVRVQHGRRHVLVAPLLLHGADVVAGLEQVRGKRVTEGVAPDAMGELGSLTGLGHRTL